MSHLTFGSGTGPSERMLELKMAYQRQGGGHSSLMPARLWPQVSPRRSCVRDREAKR